MKTYEKPKCTARTIQLTTIVAMSPIKPGGDDEPIGSNGHRYNDYDDDWDEE